MKDKFKKVANMEAQVYFPNIEDWNEDFWPNNYLIQVTAQGIPFAVNAEHEQDAIDYIIDYCEEHMPGLLYTHEEAEELRQESITDYGDERYIDDYISGGNHCLYLSTHNVHIEKL